MQVVDIEVVGPEPPEARLNGLVYGGAPEANIIGTLPHLVPNLARQDRPLPPSGDNPAKNFFRLPLVVHVRGIEKVDSRVKALIDQAASDGLVGLGAERHGTEGAA